MESTNTKNSTDLIQFRKDTAAWLENNCPSSIRQPIRDESDYFWGGKNGHFKNEGVQLFAGIGMTDDEEIRFFLKRVRVVQHTFGGANYHLDRYARLNGF